MNSTTNSDRPSWQTEPCPSWCTWPPHKEDEFPEDGHHAGLQLKRTLPLERPVQVSDGKW